MEKQKKFSIASIALLLTGVFLFSSCGQESFQRTIKEQKEKIAMLQDSLAKLNKIAKNELLYLPNGDPKETIPICKAQKLYEKYDERARIIRKYDKASRDFRPSRTISFDYQELVNYFNFIEKLTEKTGNKISQLRFFFGKYSEESKKYPGQQMLFFNPTIQDKDGRNIAYAIKNEGDNFSIIDINDLEDYECPNNTKIINKGSIFSSSSIQEVISLEGQGGQVSPPD